jgi:hypothetical protein
MATLLARLAEPAAYTIPEFCKAHRISAPTYYKLKAAGLTQLPDFLVDFAVGRIDGHG